MICQPTNMMCEVAPLRPSGRPSEARGPHSLKVLESALIFRPIAFYTQMHRKSLICVDALIHFDVMLSCGEGIIQLVESVASFDGRSPRRCHCLYNLVVMSPCCGSQKRGLRVYSFTPPLIFDLLEMSALVTPAEGYEKGLFGTSGICS